MIEAQRAQAVEKIFRDRAAGHRVLFGHRHPARTPDFHPELIADLHDASIEKLVVEAFRRAAKSTLAEEAVVLMACLGCFRNGVIVGANEDRGIERLEAIKNEIDTNEMIHEIFGDMRGSVWTATKIVLANGVMIRAVGREQRLRGTKHHSDRPDFALIDDFEDEETTATKEQCLKGLRWIYKTLIPAMARTFRMIFVGNRLDPEAVIVKLARDPAWKHLRYPIEHKDPETGERVASWPEMFPLTWIDATRDEYIRQGILGDFMQEYMCEAEAESEKLFRDHMIKVRPAVKAWEAAWCMFDPARTIKKTSATTGYACWSWVGHKLVIWDSWAKLLMPDQIIEAMFTVDEMYRPVVIGVEEDGLEEFIRQPLRQAQAQRGHVLPIRGLRAPKGKIDFIKGLQPYFNAGEVEFAQELPELKEQLLGFPSGKIDAPNALAYALRIRPGSPMYDEFTRDNIMEDLGPIPNHPVYLCLNAHKSYVTGVAVQFKRGLRIIGDWVMEGDPTEVVGDLVSEARLYVGQPIKLVAPPYHWERWTGIGLPAAVARLPADLQRGGKLTDGRDELRRLFRQHDRGAPALQIAYGARWTLNGFSGGYARDITKDAGLSDQAADGAYKVLMEGLESWAALIAHTRDEAEDDDAPGNWAYTDDNRRYRTAMSRRA